MQDRSDDELRALACGCVAERVGGEGLVADGEAVAAEALCHADVFAGVRLDGQLVELVVGGEDGGFDVVEDDGVVAGTGPDVEAVDDHGGGGGVSLGSRCLAATAVRSCFQPRSMPMTHLIPGMGWSARMVDAVLESEPVDPRPLSRCFGEQEGGNGPQPMPVPRRKP